MPTEMNPAMKPAALLFALICASFVGGAALAEDPAEGAGDPDTEQTDSAGGGDGEPNLGDNPDAYTDYAGEGIEDGGGVQMEAHGSRTGGGQKGVGNALSRIQGDSDDDRCDAADLQKKVQSCR